MIRIMELPVRISWNDFKVGTSVFIPCLDIKPVQKYVLAEAYRRKYNVICKQVVDKNRYGLRCWRIEW